ncbi:ribonuclease Oy [Euwallacea similis]|uniref:ribonuclease Oy n=1 Tax=Euwallacea similis TaxID=1736056 RepID=UPI00344B1E29
MRRILLLVIFHLIAFSHQGKIESYKNGPKPTPYHDWDYMVYSQRWPNTACAEWEESKTGNTCNLPQDKTLWTIHGLWPTKIGQLGPFFCPSAIHFDPDDLKPMLNDLSTYWINVEANTRNDSFWAHEWKKHGSCASILPALDSVTNYFKVGLQLNREFDLASLLAVGGVIPGMNSYNVSLIYNLIKNATTKNPDIQCVLDKKSKESLLSEIRICFDKSFNVIDCNESSSTDLGTNTNCNLQKPVWYINNVSVYNARREYDNDFNQQRRYIWLYFFLRSLIWITL